MSKPYKKQVRMSKSHLSIFAIIVLLAIFCVFTILIRKNVTNASIESTGKPNFVVIMVDDMTKDQLSAMPYTRQLLMGKGVTFENFIATNPICCPSRTTFFTGQYDHNHKVRSNVGPDGGYASYQRHVSPPSTLASRLKNNGYATIMVGKFLNSYSGTPPAGWTDWYGKLYGAGGQYYNYGINRDGAVVRYGIQPSDYSTDVERFISTVEINQKMQNNKPFLLYFAPYAPHMAGAEGNPAPPTPARRHLDLYKNAPLPNKPSYMEVDVSDKPTSVQNREITNMAFDGIPIRKNYTRGLESLRSVDETVQALVQSVKNAGKLQNTYFIFMSDNGFMYGEHRIKAGKSQPYEEVINVPLIIRGPGIPQGKISTALAANVDIASTIYDITNVSPGIAQDGKSLLPYMYNINKQSSIPILIQGGWLAGQQKYQFKGLRTNKYTYVIRSSNEEELYDLDNDPFQLVNVANSPSYSGIKASLLNHFNQIKNCKGTSCQQSLSGV